MVIRLGEFSTQLKFYSRIAELPPLPKGLAVFDANTETLLKNTPPNAHVLDPGEENKTWESVTDIVDQAFASGLSRDSVFTGVGGGVVGDVCAFAASIYMRGAGLVLIPTTLLSMVDASLGGKTGIDYRGYKNLLGTFYPAREVWICPEFIQTLPQREYKSGLAEVIKHGMLSDSGLFKLLREKRGPIISRDREILEGLVPSACSVKISYLEKDFRETGVRAYLNLGHTFGHALERVTGFKVSHGEAVAWGIGKSLELGLLLGITDKGYAQDAKELLTAYGFPLSYPGSSPEKILESMRGDKKKKMGKLAVIVQKSLGETQIAFPEEPDILKVLSE